jgi:hypothetical protein
MKALRSFETSVSICQLPYRNIPKDFHLQQYRRENLKFHRFVVPNFRYLLHKERPVEPVLIHINQSPFSHIFTLSSVIHFNIIIRSTSTSFSWTLSFIFPTKSVFNLFHACYCSCPYEHSYLINLILLADSQCYGVPHYSVFTSLVPFCSCYVQVLAPCLRPPLLSTL